MKKAFFVLNFASSVESAVAIHSETARQGA